MLGRLPRRLLGVAFIDSGIATLRDDGKRAERARRLGISDPAQATRAIGAVQVGAGALLLLGRFRRLASLALALTVVPDALTAHAFWSEDDKLSKGTERTLFIRDIGLLGGLLVSAADTGGRESVPHRAKRNATKAAKKTAKKAASATS